MTPAGVMQNEYKRWGTTGQG